MPSLTWAIYRLLHLEANSESGSSSGIKPGEKEFCLALVFVPAISPVGMSMMPSGF